MRLDRSDYWAIFLAIASTIIATLADQYSINLARDLFTFLAGVFTTIFAQSLLEIRRRKRDFEEKMRERVYGPLYNELNSILTNLEGFQAPTNASLDRITKRYRFRFGEKRIQKRIEELIKRLPRYAALQNDAWRETETYIMKSCGKHNVEWEVRFIIWIAGREEYVIPLTEPIFQDKDPLDFLIEKVESYENARFIVRVGRKTEGAFSKEHRIHQFSMEILKEVRKDPLIMKHRKEREYLLKECHLLIQAIGEALAP